MNARDTFVNDNNKLKSPEELLQFAALPWRHDRQGNIRVLMVTPISATHSHLRWGPCPLDVNHSTERNFHELLTERQSGNPDQVTCHLGHRGSIHLLSDLPRHLKRCRDI